MKAITINKRVIAAASVLLLGLSTWIVVGAGIRYPVNILVIGVVQVFFIWGSVVEMKRRKRGPRPTDTLVDFVGVVIGGVLGLLAPGAFIEGEGAVEIGMAVGAPLGAIVGALVTRTLDLARKRRD